MDKLNIEAERVAFEAHFDPNKLDLSTIKDAWGRGEYKHSHIECLWTGWQARASQAPAPSPAVDQLQRLKWSINGDCYLGQDAEIELIESILAGTASGQAIVAPICEAPGQNLACPRGCLSPEDGGNGCVAVTGDCADSPAAPSPASAAKPAGVDDDLSEGLEILDLLIENIKNVGNYSEEATLTFLGQIRQCLAAPISEDAGKDAIPCKFDGYGCGSQGPYCAKCTSCFAPAAPSGIAPASIGHDHVFQNMIVDWHELCSEEKHRQAHALWKRMVAHIDAHCARLASQSASAKDAAEEKWREGWMAGMTEAQELLAGDILDAERYQWLRNGTTSNRMPHVTQYPYSPGDNPRFPQIRDVGMDAAIDAARNATTKADHG